MIKTNNFYFYQFWLSHKLFINSPVIRKIAGIKAVMRDCAKMRALIAREKVS